MFKPALPESKDALFKVLKKWKVVPEVYQLAEGVFRQLMMADTEARFKYHGEEKINGFRDSNLSCSAREGMLYEHIAHWESAHPKMAYGFEVYEVDEFKRDEAMVNSFNKLVAQLCELTDCFADITKKEETKRWLSEIRNRIQDRQLSTDGTNNKYVDSKGGLLTLKGPQHHDYFTRYIAFGSLVFSRIFGKRTENFLSLKIKREHPDVEAVKKHFSRNQIADRLRNIQTYQELEALPINERWITEEFLRYLAKKNENMQPYDQAA